MHDPRRVAPGYLALFASLYALQGVVVAYFFNYNQLYMIAGGVSSTTAADAQSLALVPFILKFLGGPISDRFNLLGWGHRKPYIVLGLVVQSLGLVGLSLVHPGTSLRAFTALAVVTVAGLALYDTCCDGMVIDVTPPADRDRVQGMLVASRAAAAMVCTLGFGFLLEATGNGPGRGSPVLWICAGLGLVPLVLALASPEPRRAGDAESFQWRALGVLVKPRRARPAGVRGVLRPRRLRRRDQPQPVLRPGASVPRGDHRRPGRGPVRRAGHRRGALAGRRGPAGTVVDSQDRPARAGSLDRAPRPWSRDHGRPDWPGAPSEPPTAGPMRSSTCWRWRRPTRGWPLRLMPCSWP